jgi:hypothetical protein
MDNTTTLADPFTRFNVQFFVHMTAVIASLGRRIEAINQMNDFPFGGCHIAQDAHEFRAGQVAYFATPQGLHPLHVQVFKEEIIELIGQLMRQFEKPIAALVDRRLMNTGDNDGMLNFV